MGSREEFLCPSILSPLFLCAANVTVSTTQRNLKGAEQSEKQCQNDLACVCSCFCRRRGENVHVHLDVSSGKSQFWEGESSLSMKLNKTRTSISHIASKILQNYYWT